MVCAVIALPLVVLAQLVRDEPPERVAILNVAGDQASGQRIAFQLRKALLDDDQFDPIQSGRLAVVLEKALDEDPAAAVARQLADVDQQIAGAVTLLTKLKEKAAESELRSADRTLTSMRPTPEVLERLAEVNFQLGRIYSRQSDPTTATETFRVVLRLQPNRAAPNPGKYDPDVISAWKLATSPQSKSADVEITSPYDGADVYIDGVKVGVTPHKAAVEPGPHYFYAHLDDMEPFGRRATAIRREPREIEMSITRLPADALAAQEKRALMTGGITDQTVGETVKSIYDLNRVKFVIAIVDRSPTGYSAGVFNQNGRLVRKWVEISEKSAIDVIKGLPGRIDLDPKSDPRADAGLVAGGRDADTGGGNRRKGRPWWKDPMTYVAVGGAIAITAAGLLVFASGDDVPPPGPNGTVVAW